MTLKSNIADPATGIQAQVYHRNGDRGLKVFTAELKEKNLLFLSALNPALGNEMAIDASFGGTPEIIHDGADDSVAWTASAISGTKFTFDSTTQKNSGNQSVETANASVSDTMQFERYPDVDLSNFIGLSMFVYVTSNWAASSADSVILYGWDTSTSSQVGTSIRLEDHFNETNFGEWQKLAIPLAHMNLVGETIDAFRIEISAKSGQGPIWYLDDFQLEETGGTTEFIIEAPKGTKYTVSRLRFSFVDAYDAALVNNSMPNLSYNQILGEASLANGIGYNLIIDGVSTSSTFIKNIGDSLKSGGDLINLISDGTNTYITLQTVLDSPIILDARNDDKILVAINDDLTGLISFEVLAVGFTEKIEVSL